MPYLSIYRTFPHRGSWVVKWQPGISSSVQRVMDQIKERKRRNGYSCNSSRSLINEVQVPEHTMQKEQRKAMIFNTVTGMSQEISYMSHNN